MASIRIPRYLIHGAAGGGVRLFPRPPHFVEEKKHEQKYVTNEQKPVGDFHNWEYRFWCPVSYNSPKGLETVYQCRACLHIARTKDERREHHNGEVQCTVRLINSYNDLIKQGSCVICGKHQSKKKWGVPMCSDVCEKAWCEAEVQPNTLFIALEAEKVRMQIAKAGAK